MPWGALFSTMLLATGIAGSVVGSPLPAEIEPDPTRDGAVSVQPDHGVSGEFGTWTVTYTVGEPGIQTGGGIRVQLPDAWHAGPRNSANRLQSSDPEGNHYVRATASRSGVQVATEVEAARDNVLIKHAKRSLDGRYERYVFVTRAEVIQGELREGDQLSVVYGDRTFGSSGYRAAAVATPPLPILVAVDPTGEGSYRLHQDRPTITSRPGSAVELLFHAPSQGQANEPMECRIALVDKEANPVDHAARIALSAGSLSARFPDEVRIPAGQGFTTFEIVPEETGILRLKARARGHECQALSNPVEITHNTKERATYWGDLHSHTRFSWDGVGYGAFRYAQHVSGLDFYAMTDHSMPTSSEGFPRGLYEGYWDEYTELTERHHQPNEFVTLHAYECSFGSPYGHHNVFFKGRPGPLLTPQSTTLPKLWDALTQGDALTIPHHTGKFPSGIEFSPQNNDFRRNFELYSGHGLSEAFNPDHPLAFEQSLFTSDSSSLQEPTYAQDVWQRGLHLSTIAASDDHRAQPGQPHYGLTAIRAEELTREAVFEALYNRRTYGTTGAKILLELQLNGTPMGKTAEVSETPTIHLKASGTDAIRSVELLRWQPGDDTFSVIRQWHPEQLDWTTEASDPDWQAGSIYYMRLQQENTVRGRPVMAWSSPIWTR